MIPSSFYTQSTLRSLNIAAVGLALAALTSAIASFTEPEMALACGIPTLLVGATWAALLRWRKTLGNSTFRVAWLLSVPLAAVNAGLACTAAFTRASHANLVLEPEWFIFGATIGGIIWVPALITTLLCFGIPIAKSQRLAALGIVGEEVGESLVGRYCARFSGIALLMTMYSASIVSPAPLPLVFPLIAALLGLLAGVTTSVLASYRQKRRNDFVAKVDAGEIPGYQLKSTPAGKALVRVVGMGEGYRVANFSEEILHLDESGNARLALRKST